jgi:hypothetical protein
VQGAPVYYMVLRTANRLTVEAHLHLCPSKGPLRKLEGLCSERPSRSQPPQLAEFSPRPPVTDTSMGSRGQSGLK